MLSIIEVLLSKWRKVDRESKARCIAFGFHRLFWNHDVTNGFRAELCKAIYYTPNSSKLTSVLCFQVFINAGILLGYVSNFAFSRLPLKLGWRIMLGLGVFPAIMIALGVLIMPESPRWLVMRGQLGEARRVLNRISDSEEEAMRRLAAIKSTVGIPESCDDEVVQVHCCQTPEFIYNYSNLNYDQHLHFLFNYGKSINDFTIRFKFTIWNLHSLSK